uniref:Uncharacterized protein n=1 Tax=Avena sativa TaxID=4498 RepID=A0ACD5UI99_AVESA
MALATRQCLLVIIHALAVMAISVGAADITGGSFVSDCDQRSQVPSAANGTAFRASLAPLLAALPSAAAPTGFASLRSGNGRAFARGLCFDESPAPHDCRECLSISIGRMPSCKGSRRAGIWNAGCFLAYADTTNASSWEADEFFASSFAYEGNVANYYPDFYDVQRLVDLAHSLAPRAANSASGRMLATASAAAQANSTVRALAQCPEDVTAADCTRCLERSAEEVAPCLRSAYKHDGLQSAGVAHVFRYGCFLRLEISAPMGKGARLPRKMRDHLAVVVVVAVAIVVVVVGAAFLVVKRVRTRKTQAALPTISTAS